MSLFTRKKYSFYTHDYTGRALRPWVVVVGILAVVVAFSFALAQLVYRTDKYGCSRTAEKLGLNYDHGFWSGCLVQTDDGWVDIEKVRVEFDG